MRLHVTQSKFNPCKREIVSLTYSYLADGTSSVDMFSWLAKRKNS